MSFSGLNDSPLNSHVLDGTLVSSTSVTPPIEGFDLIGEFNSSPVNYIEVDGRLVFTSIVIDNLLSSVPVIKFTQCTGFNVSGLTISYAENVIYSATIQGQIAHFSHDVYTLLTLSTA